MNWFKSVIFGQVLLLLAASIFSGLALNSMVVEVSRPPHFEYSCVESVERKHLKFNGEIWIYWTANECKKYQLECWVGKGYTGTLTCADLYARGRI